MHARGPEEASWYALGRAERGLFHSLLSKERVGVDNLRAGGGEGSQG